MRKTYIYCKSCQNMTEFLERCSHCGAPLTDSTKSNIEFIIDKSNPHFSHALGKVVRNNTEERKEAKSRGMIELGRENPHKYIKPSRRKKYTW